MITLQKNINMIHDSELTTRGTKRRVIYNGDKSEDFRLTKIARDVAEKDIQQADDTEYGYKIGARYTRLSPEKFKECLPKIEIINI